MDNNRKKLHLKILKELGLKDSNVKGFRPFKLDSYHILKLIYIVTRKNYYSRLINLYKWLYDRNRSILLNSYPLVITFESSVSCNLACPNCVNGARLPFGDRNGMASINTMKTIINKVYKKSFQFAFHNNGEPFLNKEIFKGIRFANQKGLWTCAHSNLNYKEPDFAKNIIDSKLNDLVISCDGASQEVYEIYRKKGDITTVFKNIEKIATLKRKYKSFFPLMTAKFHVFDHNWHEILNFKKSALAAGVNNVIFLKAFSNGIYKTGRAGTEKVFNLSKLEWETPKRKLICPHVWSEEVHIDYDGGIMPCGNGYEANHLFLKHEDTINKSIQEQLNTKDFIRVRKFFSNNFNIPRESLPLLCKSCEYTIRNNNNTY